MTPLRVYMWVIYIKLCLMYSNCFNCSVIWIFQLRPWTGQRLIKGMSRGTLANMIFAIRRRQIMPKVRLELATPGLQTQCSSHWAIQLKSYCWEGVEFIQLVYCIIIYLSFLNCSWLLIREVQWFYWTQKLLVPVEKFTVRMPKVRLELATPGLEV